MTIIAFTGGMVQTNAFLIEAPVGHVLVDAPDGVAEWLDRRGIRPSHLLLTHQHYDHVEDAAAVAARGAQVLAFAPYSTELTLESHARAWGMPISVEPFVVDRLLGEGEHPVAGLNFVVSHVPGHATDGLVFHLPETGVLFAGDTLFAGSIGRPDLPGGDIETLLRGITTKVMCLPRETRVLSGHGPETTVGREAATNPYLR